jgi:fumarylacetoacetase
MIAANDPNLKSWVDVPSGSDFPIQNLPFGCFEHGYKEARAGIRIGDHVLDLFELHATGLLDDLGMEGKDTIGPLNDLIGRGKAVTNALRNRVSELLRHDNGKLKNHAAIDTILLPIAECRMKLPVEIGDYTDFYSSEDHARNVGTMFRDPDNALLPNWKHLPVAYHGRASSIVVSGTPIRRPKGQQIPADSTQPVFGPSKLLDFELEVGFILGKNNPLGSSISTAEAEDHIFGLVLFNDLSARDIQKWEYVPLGPFLAKNFGSPISPWIVTLEALEPFRVRSYEQDPEVLPYLKYDGACNYDIQLEVALKNEAFDAHPICRSNFKYMYWTMVQQLAHHTVNGCNTRVGDIYASGTISGPEPGSFGSMLEITWRGTKPLDMPDGTQRKFVQDGDSIIMRGWAEKDGVRIGFGEVDTEILPASE